MSKSEVGEWAKDKLERLRKYLHAYTTILRTKQFEGYYYFDAFAGPGSHHVRTAREKRPFAHKVFLESTDYVRDQKEQQAFLAGSPRVALDLKHPFTGYIFIEKDPERAAELLHLQTHYRGVRSIRVRQRDCNEYLLNDVVANPRIDWRRNRAVVFLDPFGMQVPWTTLEALGRTRAIEVFLNFPVGMAIQRLLLRKPEQFTERQRANLDEYFGSPEWFDVLYRPRKTLFGDEEAEKIERSGRALLDWYRGRLRAEFGHASKATLIRNTKGGHLYYLLLATPSTTGAKIANDILSAGESV